MKRNKALERIGFRYILNHNSQEIHRVSELKKICLINEMKNAGYHMWLSQYIAKRLKGYDGCKFCNPKYHKK